jgi:hypothetical protein
VLIQHSIKGFYMRAKFYLVFISIALGLIAIGFGGLKALLGHNDELAHNAHRFAGVISTLKTKGWVRAYNKRDIEYIDGDTRMELTPEDYLLICPVKDRVASCAVYSMPEGTWTGVAVFVRAEDPDKAWQKEVDRRWPEGK